MRFGVLGPLAVWTDTGQDVAVPGAKVRALLADLLVHHGRAVSAQTLIEDLWEGTPPAGATGALQSKVAQLRRALERAEPGGRALVERAPHGYRLRAEPDRVDAARFAELAAAGRHGEALALWRGPAYAGFAEAPFARAAAERLEERRVTAFEGLAEEAVARGAHGALADELAAMLAAHPLRERLHAVRIRGLYLDGRQAEALAAYREIRDRLARELGVDPGPELTAVHAAVLRQDPALAEGGSPGPAEPAGLAPSGGPVPYAGLAALVGRDEAVAEVRALLRAHRLVTLTGPAGVGKTRLALEVAAAEGGARVVELAGVDAAGARRDPAVLAERIAGALGVRGDLGRALGTRRLLLVLDTVEHLAVPAARLVVALLGAAPGLRVLATGREPLAVPGERQWPVAPLAARAAVRLFRERVADAVPGFTGDDAEIAAVCRRLDGLPLAIELAAARVRTLGLREVAARLDDRFRLLGAGARTLRAAFDWSWELLDDGERAVLRRLSVCAGGFDLATAEAVAAGPGVARGDVAGTVAALADRSLITVDGPAAGRFGLLESVAAYARERLADAEEATAYAARHARYFTRLAEQADGRLRGPEQREWLRRLDAETPNLRAALAGCLARHEGGAALRLCGALGWYWFLRGRYREAHRAFGAALAATDPPDAPAGGTGAGGATRPGAPDLRDRPAGPGRDGAGPGAPAGPDASHGGGHEPGRDRPEADGPASAVADGGSGRTGALVWRAALEAWERMPGGEPLGAAPPSSTSRQRWLLGFARADGGDLPAAVREVDRALADFRRAGDRWGVAAALGVLGWESLRLGDTGAARREGEEARELFREAGDLWGQAHALRLLGVLAEVGGDYERAGRLHREGLAAAEELQLWPVVVEEFSQLGRLAALAGAYARADAHYGRALHVARERGFHHGVVHARVGLGTSARRQGRLDAAEEHLHAAEQAHRADGYRSGLAYVLAELGFVAEQRGDADKARAHHTESLALARAASDPRAVALATEGLAGAASLAGDGAGAARLLAEAARIRPLPPAERTDVDRIAARIAEAPGP
ncbi:BTAD domain-containing putative transcriptional regulator [Streptomyces sp. WMMC500]|uniref:BTAD domain-containing putative transcriptional regulator n=1 Tax=Streptomyces sp. WMMC500 TaxID=3015154 RepID=UPI00248BCC09|nr:BTAD domain-containing putative transcriptional regulator [Streptomyces sp. WMMC500]WBB63104.1 BTAD domain-containing putative transcriptional regulator [Streptomyces sp. WMMC500]